MLTNFNGAGVGFGTDTSLPNLRTFHILCFNWLVRYCFSTQGLELVAVSVSDGVSEVCAFFLFLFIIIYQFPVNLEKCFWILIVAHLALLNLYCLECQKCAAYEFQWELSFWWLVWCSQFNYFRSSTKLTFSKTSIELVDFSVTMMQILFGFFSTQLRNYGFLEILNERLDCEYWNCLLGVFKCL